ncbi:MAG: hypothetical protein LAQ69_11495 [Acidobacteriia bacterium]|nr:hypothetical protein [Terriglobia bacterium]
MLVGFFRSERKGAAAAPPKDEWEPILRNALLAPGQPVFTVWSHALPKGRNELDFGRGAYVVLGFIKKEAQPEPRMVSFQKRIRSSGRTSTGYSNRDHPWDKAVREYASLWFLSKT